MVNVDSEAPNLKLNNTGEEFLLSPLLTINSLLVAASSSSPSISPSHSPENPRIKSPVFITKVHDVGDTEIGSSISLSQTKSPLSLKIPNDDLDAAKVDTGTDNNRSDADNEAAIIGEETLMKITVLMLTLRLP